MGMLAGLLSLLLVGSYALIPSDMEDEAQEPDTAEDEPEAETNTDTGNLLDAPEEVPANTEDQMPEEPPVLVLEASMQITGTDDPDVLSGQGGADALSGEGGTDQINGYAGDDEMRGGSGDDTLHGGSGDDQLHGDDGNDEVHGEAGDDTVYGGSGADELSGHFGADHVEGGAGQDTLTGGAGDDSLSGDAGNDALHGNDDNDTLDGGAGQDVLFGGSGNDLLVGVEDGEAEQDFLNAGSGDDTLVVGGTDVATGSEGHDTFILGDWIANGSVAVLQDFDLNDDTLVVVYDETAYDEMPTVTMTEDGSGGGVTHIHLNGNVIASLQGVSGLTSDGFMVISHSDAVSSGLMNAA